MVGENYHTEHRVYCIVRNRIETCYSDDKIYLEQLLGISIRREPRTFILLGLTYHYEREDNSSHDQNI
jgi:hypothetical protein